MQLTVPVGLPPGTHSSDSMLRMTIIILFFENAWFEIILVRLDPQVVSRTDS